MLNIYSLGPEPDSETVPQKPSLEELDFIRQVKLCVFIAPSEFKLEWLYRQMMENEFFLECWGLS